MRIPIFRWSCKAAWIVSIVLLPMVGKSEDTLVVFGLTNQALNGATLLPRESYPGLRVEGLLEEGHQGVSVALGQADSGLFFMPQLNEQPNDGNFMQASVFGKAGAHERLVATLFCKKES